MIKTYIKMIFYPTEELEKLKRVLLNVFEIPDEEIRVEEKEDVKMIYGEIEGVKGISNMFQAFRNQLIVQSARKVIFGKMRESTVSFMLNKQALYVNKFHFCHNERESPLGPVWIRIESDDIERVINYLVPQTDKGKVLEVDYTPK